MAKRQEGWKQRNNIIKTLRANDDHGWLHLYIAQNKDTLKTLMRLKKYMNWFSIPSPTHLVLIQKMLKEGAKELGWDYDESCDIKIEVNSGLHEVNDSGIHQGEIPDEIIDFIENYPDFVQKLISLKIMTDDINYIFDLIKILNDSIMQSGFRIKVAFKELVEKISKQDAKSMQELSDLMEKWSLLQITSFVNIIKSRLDTIEIFEKMIHDENTYEINTDKSIHRVLENSMWLIDENYWIVSSNRSLRNFIGDEIVKHYSEYAKKRPDFACVDYENKLTILEIKRPSLELTKKELDQAELYQLLIKKFKGQSYRSIEVYLIGNSISEEARDIVDCRKNVIIKTYNDLLDNCRRRYKNYLEIFERNI